MVDVVLRGSNKDVASRGAKMKPNEPVAHISNIGTSKCTVGLGPPTWIGDQPLYLHPLPVSKKLYDSQVISEFLERSGKWVVNDAIIAEIENRVAEACAKTLNPSWFVTHYSLRNAITALRSGEWRKHI